MPIRKQKITQIAVKLPSELLERLRIESKRSGVSMSHIIREGILHWLNLRGTEVVEALIPKK